LVEPIEKVMPLAWMSASESSVPPMSAVKSPVAPLSPGFMKIAPPYHRSAYLTVAPAGIITVPVDDTGVVRGKLEPPDASEAMSCPPASATP
jgi:hypothetical protein